MGRPEEVAEKETTGPETLWNVHECAKYLRMSVSWVYRQVERKEIPHAKFGHALRFSPARMREYAANRTREPGGKVIDLPRRGKR
jgi:excisionase family DNA binding protein